MKNTVEKLPHKASYIYDLLRDEGGHFILIDYIFKTDNLESKFCNLSKNNLDEINNAHTEKSLTEIFNKLSLDIPEDIIKKISKNNEKILGHNIVKITNNVLKILQSNIQPDKMCDQTIECIKQHLKVNKISINDLRIDKEISLLQFLFYYNYPDIAIKVIEKFKPILNIQDMEIMTNDLLLLYASKNEKLHDNYFVSSINKLIELGIDIKPKFILKIIKDKKYGVFNELLKNNKKNISGLLNDSELKTNLLEYLLTISNDPTDKEYQSYVLFLLSEQSVHEHIFNERTMFIKDVLIKLFSTNKEEILEISSYQFLLNKLMNCNEKFDLSQQNIDIHLLIATAKCTLSYVDYNELVNTLNLQFNSIDSSRINFLSTLDRKLLLSLFSCYHDVCSLFKVKDENYQNLDYKEASQIFQDGSIKSAFRITHNENKIFTDILPVIYVFNLNDKKFVIGIPDEHKLIFFSVKNINQFCNILSNNLLFTHSVFQWELVRQPYKKADIYAEEDWLVSSSTGILKIYDDNIEDIYANIIRPRILEAFEEILKNIHTPYIRIFEVGAGLGQAGILCAKHAMDEDHEVTLYPSDIHAKNLSNIPNVPNLRIITHVLGAHNIEQYLADVNKDLLNKELSSDTTCILISSGCLCFEIIPGGYMEDYMLMQKMHRYGIDFLIADGLEAPIINRTLPRDMYQVRQFENFGAPLIPDSFFGGIQPRRGMNYCIVLQKNELPEKEIVVFEDQLTLDLSFHPNPVQSLSKILENFNKDNSYITIDLRCAYIESSEYELQKFYELISNLLQKSCVISIIINKSLYASPCLSNLEKKYPSVRIISAVEIGKHDLLVDEQFTPTPNNIRDLPDQSLYLYVLTNDNLYFFNKLNGEYTQMRIYKEHINDIKQFFKYDNTPKYLIKELSTEQLNKLITSTGKSIPIGIDDTFQNKLTYMLCGTELDKISLTAEQKAKQKKDTRLLSNVSIFATQNTPSLNINNKSKENDVNTNFES